MTNATDKAFNGRTISTTVREGDWESQVLTDGLTKREYFAAMAMAGLMANFEWLRQLDETLEGHPSLNRNDVPPIAAKWACASADALIEVLNMETK